MVRDPYRWLVVVLGGFGGAGALVYWLNGIRDAHPEHDTLIWMSFVGAMLLFGWVFGPIDRRMNERAQARELEPDSQSRSEYSRLPDLEPGKLTIEHEQSDRVRRRLK